MSSNIKYIRLKNMYNKCTKNLYLVNVAFDKILDVQGSTLTVVRLPGASEMCLRASENGTQLVRSGK